MLVLLLLLLVKALILSIDLTEEVISLVRQNRKRKPIQWILLVSALTAFAVVVLMQKALLFGFVVFVIGFVIL